MRDLDRMVEYLKANMNKRIILVGFADNSGDYYYNLNLAGQRTSVVTNELKMRGLNIHQAINVGEDIPVASNLTAKGREKNRRVEVWVK